MVKKPTAAQSRALGLIHEHKAGRKLTLAEKEQVERVREALLDHGFLIRPDRPVYYCVPLNEYQFPEETR